MMSEQSTSRSCVNVIPTDEVKKEIKDETEDSVFCKLCSKGYASEKALNNHVKIEHIEAYASGDPKLWTQPALKMVPNPILQVWVKTNENLCTSQMKPTDITCLASKDVSYIIMKSDDVTPKTRKKRSANKNKKSASDKPQILTGPFECLQPSNDEEDGTCHKTFDKCCDYSIHYRDNHTKGRKALRCQVCEKPLVCQGLDPLTPFTCEVCGEAFETNMDLSEHSSTAHVKLKPYKCNLCPKRFTQQGGLIQHTRMHTGDRPFRCKFCPKRFTQHSGLAQHHRTHTKDRPYKCVICSKAFSQGIHMRQHMRTHTKVSPYQCGFCDKRFKQSIHLNSHLKTHNPANMSDEQKVKYSELIGLIEKDFVEVGMEKMKDSDQEENEAEVEEIEESEVYEEMEEADVIKGQKVWISKVER